MQVRVLREACCAQDDQAGPLEAVHELAPDAAFETLVDAIVSSRFLQYSSSHAVLQGEVAGMPVVRVFSPVHSGNRPAEFLAGAGRPVASVVGDGVLWFRFVFPPVPA